MRTLIEADDRERRSLERTLHDGLLQQLVAFAVGLQLLRRAIEDDPPEATALVDELRHDVDRALEDARRLAEAIYPSLLEAGGLVRALHAAAAAAPVPTRVDGLLEKRLSPTAALTVHRCCATAMHAVTGDGARATVTVRGDGDVVAFELVVANGILGAEWVAPLAARVEALGGTLDAGPRHVAGRLHVDS